MPISSGEIIDKGISLMAGIAAICYSKIWRNKPGYEGKAKWFFYCGVILILCIGAVFLFDLLR